MPDNRPAVDHFMRSKFFFRICQGSSPTTLAWSSVMMNRRNSTLEASSNPDTLFRMEGNFGSLDDWSPEQLALGRRWV